MPSREGSLEAPIRHPIAWRDPDYYDEGSLNKELERVFDICHGCRRCFSLCNAFPTLFDLIDESDSGELDSVPQAAYGKVVEHCYLCDMCYMTKCPYVPPHEWNVDFPHLMLRAKANQFKVGGARLRDKVLSATDTVGRLASIPVIAEAVNAVNASGAGRALLERALGVARDAMVPTYASRTARKALGAKIGANGDGAVAAGPTSGRVAVFSTCYGNYNAPGLVEDLVAVLEHNEIVTALVADEHCCGMPKLELGDLDAVAKLKDLNIGELHRLAQDGWDLTAVVPSCVLMFKQELPLMFPGDERVRAVGEAFFDPFDYLMARHKAGRLALDFKEELGNVTYQVPCHLRVQNIGFKTRDVLELIRNTSVNAIERCSGHDGTYAVKKEYHETSKKIGRPVARQVDAAKADRFTSDCPMAAAHIASLAEAAEATHPIQLLRRAYGI